MPKIRWILEQKKHHVTAWRASGFIRMQYCELYDIAFKSLRQWPQDIAKAERRAKAPEVIPVHVSASPAGYNTDDTGNRQSDTTIETRCPYSCVMPQVVRVCLVSSRVCITGTLNHLQTPCAQWRMCGPTGMIRI